MIPSLRLGSRRDSASFNDSLLKKRTDSMKMKPKKSCQTYFPSVSPADPSCCCGGPPHHVTCSLSVCLAKGRSTLSAIERSEKALRRRNAAELQLEEEKQATIKRLLQRSTPAKGTPKEPTMRDDQEDDQDGE